MYYTRILLYQVVIHSRLIEFTTDHTRRLHYRYYCTYCSTVRTTYHTSKWRPRVPVWCGVPVCGWGADAADAIAQRSGFAPRCRLARPPDTAALDGALHCQA